MYPGSRCIPAVLGEIEIDTVGEMQPAEEATHDAVGIVKRARPGRHARREQATATNNECPAKHSHPTRHEESGCMKGAAVENHPDQREPEHRRQVIVLQALQGSVLVSAAERAAFAKLTALGVADLFRLFEQPPQSYSWWDYRQGAYRRNH